MSSRDPEIAKESPHRGEAFAAVRLAQEWRALAKDPTTPPERARVLLDCAEELERTAMKLL